MSEPADKNTGDVSYKLGMRQLIRFTGLWLKLCFIKPAHSSKSKSQS